MPGQTTWDWQRRYARQRPSQSDLLTAAILDVRLGRETTDSIAAVLSERKFLLFILVRNCQLTCKRVGQIAPSF
jgi:hypothetical protein